jgi:hypothetical protein
MFEISVITEDIDLKNIEETEIIVFLKNVQISYKKIYDKQENNERIRATNILFGYKLRE